MIGYFFVDSSNDETKLTVRSINGELILTPSDDESAGSVITSKRHFARVFLTCIIINSSELTYGDVNLNSGVNALP